MLNLFKKFGIFLEVPITSKLSIKYNLLILFTFILFTGCTVPTINQSMEYAWLKDETFKKVSSATVVVGPMDEWSVHEDDLDNLEEIREDIVDELDDLDIKNGRELTIKILIRSYFDIDGLSVMPGASPGSVSAIIEYYDINNKLIAKEDVLTTVPFGLGLTNVKRESEIDGFVKTVIKIVNKYLALNK